MKSKESIIRMIRMLLFSRILIVLFALSFAIFFWQRSTRELLNSVEKLSDGNPNIDMLERGITNLYQAENNFRFYSATYDKSYFNAYSENLFSVSVIIDSLQASMNTVDQIEDIGFSLDRKADVSKAVIRLKLLTDSLLNIASHWDTAGLRKPDMPLFDIRKIQNMQNKLSIDSIMDTATARRLGFFEKVKNLFKDDSTPKKNGIIVKRSEQISDTMVESNLVSTPEWALLQDIHSYYSTKISSYADGRQLLNKNERELAEINSRLIEEITGLLMKVKQVETEYTLKVKRKAAATAEKATSVVTIISIISIIIAAVFFYLVLHYLKNIKESASRLESEKQKAEMLAWQKSRFLSGMSHEIRAPLNNILGFAEQLKFAPDDNNEMYLNAINTSAELMLSTVNQILDFSKLEAGKMSFITEIFSPYKAIEIAAGTMVLRAREKNLMLNLHIPFKEDVLVAGDDFRLKQVMVNLIDNAIKYTNKGEINIHASVKPEGEKLIARIEISDTGIGIPAEKVSDIFNEFERLETEGDRRWKAGTGLGLSIVRMVIEQQGGRIYVKSTSERGTCMAVEIPYSKPLQMKPSVNRAFNAPSIPPGKTILLADDDHFSVMLVTSICKRHNITVIPAENGQQALELAMKKEIDLILTDINMPVLSGIDLTLKLKSNPQLASTPVIAVTANVMAEEVAHISQAGFNEILTKPFREKEFIEKISLFLQ